MNILEGEIPEKNKAWHVLIPYSPGRQLAKSWQFALLLAEAGYGALVLMLVIKEDRESLRRAARETIKLARESYDGKAQIYACIVTNAEFTSEVKNFIRERSIDVFVDDISDPVYYNLENCPCAVAGVRGDNALDDVSSGPIERIIVPTSGGPNTVYGLSLLLPLTPEIEVIAAYIVPGYMGENEEALGRHRLRQTLEYIDGVDRIETRLIHAASVTEGIREAAVDGDIVVIGASRESSIDKILFGNIPDSVVRESKRAVVVMREPNDRLARVAFDLSWMMQRVLPRLNLAQRTDAYVRIRRGARPNIDFYILIALSAIIASLGLMSNSAAVVIGAMLVAPLMSPIVGTGLAIVLGDTRFLRLSLGAVLRGVLLAISFGMIFGLFMRGQPLTNELMARTQPSLLDLGIALFSGMAGAYALSRSNAAGALPGVAVAAALVPPLATVGVTLTAGYFVQSLGALLLFVTNYVAIGSATALVFLILGFRPTPSQKERQVVRARSAQIAAISLVLITVLLIATSYILGEQDVRDARIREVVIEKLQEVAGAELDHVEIVDFRDRHLTLNITARSNRNIGYFTVKALQEEIGTQLVNEGIIDEIALTLTVINATNLDPLMPPTPTPGPSPTPEPTAVPTLEG